MAGILDREAIKYMKKSKYAKKGNQWLLIGIILGAILILLSSNEQLRSSKYLAYLCLLPSLLYYNWAWIEYRNKGAVKN